MLLCLGIWRLHVLVGDLTHANYGTDVYPYASNMSFMSLQNKHSSMPPLAGDVLATTNHRTKFLRVGIHGAQREVWGTSRTAALWPSCSPVKEIATSPCTRGRDDVLCSVGVCSTRPVFHPRDRGVRVAGIKMLFRIGLEYWRSPLIGLSVNRKRLKSSMIVINGYTRVVTT